MNIARNDLVEIIAGADRGKQGKVIQVLREEDRVIVQGVRMQKRHKKQIQGQAGGGIVEQEGPIHISNVRLVERSTDRAST